MISVNLKLHRLENNPEDWYVCHGHVDGMRISGYGTTMRNAIDDVFRTYKLLTKYK